MEAPHFLPVTNTVDAGAKAACRRALRARDHTLGPGAADALRSHLHGVVASVAPRAIAAFWPFPDEVDLRALLTRLHVEGRAVLLPLVVADARPLGFARWTPAATLVPGSRGPSVPASGAEGTADGHAPVPDLVLVPLLGFDRDGFRLGRGGGFYDRTLASLPDATVAIGVAAASREVPRVPVEAHDRPLDAVVTENGTIVPPGGAWLPEPAAR